MNRQRLITVIVVGLALLMVVGSVIGIGMILKSQVNPWVATYIMNGTVLIDVHEKTVCAREQGLYTAFDCRNWPTDGSKLVFPVYLHGKYVGTVYGSSQSDMYFNYPQPTP